MKHFKDTRALTVASLLCAISVIFGKLPAINITEVLRISIENFPVILAGYAFGPFAGALVGASADLLGCVIKGFAINPIITLGAVCVGLISGCVRYKIFKRRHNIASLALSVSLAHIFGNMIIKTVGLYLWYEALRPTLIFRVPTYIITAVAEFFILFFILKSKQLKKILLGDDIN